MLAVKRKPGPAFFLVDCKLHSKPMVQKIALFLRCKLLELCQLFKSGQTAEGSTGFVNRTRATDYQDFD